MTFEEKVQLWLEDFRLRDESREIGRTRRAVEALRKYVIEIEKILVENPEFSPVLRAGVTKTSLDTSDLVDQESQILAKRYVLDDVLDEACCEHGECSEGCSPSPELGCFSASKFEARERRKNSTIAAKE